MKLYHTLALLGIYHADAFTAGMARASVASRLYMKDTSEAVAAATEASKKYGETSPEARVAWELVEELDAANSHERNMKEVTEMKAEKEKLQRELMVKVPRAPVIHVDTSDAVKNALEASRLYGGTSKEAQIAWDMVEELDAANSHHTFEDIHVAKPVVAYKATEPATKKSKSLSPKTIEEAIDVAMFAKKIYGVHSAEARTAWDVVEEMDAALSDAKRNAAVVEAAAASAKKALEAVGTKEAKKTIQLTDTSSAITVALEASKTFGATSVEAKMAWEAVEEIDSANAHRKTVGTG